ncbi:MULTISPECIES: VOC family protein [Jannaschia]|nr:MULTISPECIES: VOC family protein [unclassified Jannaschia]
MKNPAKVHALGEIAIRCDDVIGMRDFYRDIVGLEILEDFADRSGIVFFKVAPGFGGHTTVLALFDKTAGAARGHPTGQAAPRTGAGSSLHHLALTVDRAAQPALRDFLDARGVPHHTEVFDWIGWRGVFIQDPEGNTVEFVAGPEQRAEGP